MCNGPSPNGCVRADDGEGAKGAVLTCSGRLADGPLGGAGKDAAVEVLAVAAACNSPLFSSTRRGCDGGSIVLSELSAAAADAVLGTVVECCLVAAMTAE